MHRLRRRIASILIDPIRAAAAGHPRPGTAAARWRRWWSAPTAEDGVTAALRAASARLHHDVAGTERRFGLSTLWSWLAQYRRGGLLALRPAPRKDRGIERAIPADILDAAAGLRREQTDRATKTIIDILVRTKRIRRQDIARSTLERYLDHVGLSRRALLTVGRKTFCRIETAAPFELVVGDFHHGPWVCVGAHDEERRALYGGFIDHFSRYVPEGRYHLHEDYVALRFGFRRLIALHGLPVSLYVDGGPAYQTNRFRAACGALGIRLPRSKPHQAEARGLIERFNRTLKEQFEAEVRADSGCGKSTAPSLSACARSPRPRSPRSSTDI